MAQHRYKIGDAVLLVPTRLERIPAGAYRVERQLPLDGPEPHYRVRHVQDEHERVVSEGQLRPAEAPAPQA